jgi:hypothetical protein
LAIESQFVILDEVAVAQLTQPPVKLQVQTRAGIYAGCDGT